MTASPANLIPFDDVRPAATWAARLDAGPLSPDEEAAFTAWLDAHPDHPAELQEHIDLYLQLSRTVPNLVRSGRWTEESPAPVIRPHPPAVSLPTPARFRRWAAGLAAAAIVAVTALWWVNRPEVFTAPIAQRQSVTLADGSHVDLNARTSLAVRLRSGERLIELADGEAYFAVSKDASRPFLVQTPTGTVRVTGTAFNVRASADSLEVTVAEGSVAVTPGQPSTAPVRLSPRDQLHLAGTASAVRTLTPDAVADALAWRDGLIVFDAEPLASAAQRFARYHGRTIAVDPSVAQLELGGRFRLDQFDRFLRDLPDAVPVTVLRGGDGTIRLVAP